MSERELAGQVAVITGAGRGIGARIAVGLARHGADVVLAARDGSGLARTAHEVEDLGRSALAVVTDLTIPSDVTQLADETLARFGHVDVLVNNSGIGGPSAVLWESDPDEWALTLDVNVIGSYRCCRAFLPGMVSQGSGSVVFIGSMTGKRPLYGRTPYAASKLALVGLTRSLALEAGRHGVRVNLVSPGPVEGERLDWVFQSQAQALGITPEQVRSEFVAGSPLRRLVRADDVADAVVFLAGPDSAAITGEDLNVSAGGAMY